VNNTIRAGPVLRKNQFSSHVTIPVARQYCGVTLRDGSQALHGRWGNGDFGVVEPKIGTLHLWCWYVDGG
jgi:hypothetical protein